MKDKRKFVKYVHFHAKIPFETMKQIKQISKKFKIEYSAVIRIAVSKLIDYVHKKEGEG